MRLHISTTPTSLSFPSFFIPTNSFLSNSPNRGRRRRRCYSVKCTTTAASLSGGGGDDSFTAKSGYLFDLSATEAETLEEYSISKIATIYYRKPIVVARRLIQTGIAFGKWFGLRFLDKQFDRADEMFEVEKLFVFSLIFRVFWWNFEFSVFCCCEFQLI